MASRKRYVLSTSVMYYYSSSLNESNDERLIFLCINDNFLSIFESLRYIFTFDTKTLDQSIFIFILFKCE